MFEEEVQHGIKQLDEHLDWRKRIDLDALEMSIDCCCILGQLYDGNYPEGLDHLFRCDVSPGVRRAWACAHGFDVPDQENIGSAYAELRKAWVAAMQGGNDID